MATEYATLAGGCFWCTEAVFKQINGVESLESGYIGGHTENPTYKLVCNGDTGHAEAIRIAFDPEKVSYGDLLDISFATHDPTQLNRQGNDIGTSTVRLFSRTAPARQKKPKRPSLVRRLSTLIRW
ncbi:hypothetical protein ERHA55_53130 (plasmid) [Erwinia rhapontici]|nr:hypothetical protein ERHA55_53130 [Erwinia rhapontici]